MTFNALVSALYIIVGTFSALVTFVGKYDHKLKNSGTPLICIRTVRVWLLLPDCSRPAGAALQRTFPSQTISTTYCCASDILLRHCLSGHTWHRLLPWVGINLDLIDCFRRFLSVL